MYIKIYIYVLQVNWTVVLFSLRNVSNVAENASRFLPPPQAFLIVFLSARSDWETGREQKGASGSPSSRVIIIRSIFARATGDKAAPFPRFPVMRFYILVVFVNNFDCNTVT